MTEKPLPPWEKPQTPWKRFFRSAVLFLAQTSIGWFLFLMLGIVFFTSSEYWGHDDSLIAIQEIARLLCYTISVYLVLKIGEDQNLTHLGFKFGKWAIRDFFAGFFISCVILAFAFVYLLSVGWIEVDGYAWQSQTSMSVLGGILISFITFTFVGWSEELLSRGFQLQIIGRGLNKFWGVLISSLLFAYYHRFNPGITWGDMLSIFSAGLIFAFAYLKTGQLWLPMGLHAGWDFFAVVIHGTPIGNLQLFHLVNSHSTPAVTGRMFNIFEYCILLALFVFTLVYVRERNKRIHAKLNADHTAKTSTL